MRYPFRIREYISLIDTSRKHQGLFEIKNIANVIISSPPHSSQLIGLKLKIKLKDKINLIIDYRDSWKGTKLYRKGNSFLQVLN